MDRVFGILIVVIFFLVVIWPLVRRTLGPAFQRWMLGRMEDGMRRMAGMPTRKQERKAAKKRARAKGGERERVRTGAKSPEAYPSAASFLRTYAEDVEYIEVKSYSETRVIGDTVETYSHTVIVEEQVEDVDFEEIKTPAETPTER
ncbi:MAG: hypothetical protein J1E97_03615 [Muribaculaceae bacterium]|nr:hypothetical protein [Muribaculaceae bacterium]